MERQQVILDELERRGACSYAELAKLLGVSSMTVRREVEELAQRGAVIKTLGAVQQAHAPSYLYETALQARITAQRREKQAIARQALELVAGNQTVFLDGSTTCLELAKVLARERHGLTIITNSALACLELGHSSENTIVGIGGQFDANSLSFVGPQAEDFANSLFVDLAFVGTKGLLPAKGTFESSVLTFRIKQLIAAHCVALVLLADHTKFGQRGLRQVLDVAQIHTVVTDDQTPKKDLALLERGGVRVLVAPTWDVPARKAAHVA